MRCNGQTGGEADLVDRGEVGWIGGGDSQLAAGNGQRNHPVFFHRGEGQRRQGIAGNRVQLSAVDRRDFQLRAEELRQALLRDVTELDQIGAYPSAEKLLSFERLGKLGFGDDAMVNEQLAQSDGRSSCWCTADHRADRWGVGAWPTVSSLPRALNRPAAGRA